MFQIYITGKPLSHEKVFCLVYYFIGSAKK